MSINLEVVLKSILANFPYHLYWQDTNGVVLGCNVSQAQALGFEDPEDITGKPLDALLPLDEAKSLLATLKEVVNTHTITETEEKVTFQGVAKLLRTIKIPVFDHSDNVVGVLGFSIDITAERERDVLKLENTKVNARSESMRFLSAQLAHDLGTPLAILRSQTRILSEDLNILIEAYDKCILDGAVSKKLSEKRYANIHRVPDILSSQVEQIYSDVKMTLANLQQGKISAKFFSGQPSIASVIKQVVADYPLEEEHKEKLDLKLADDFAFWGSEYAIRHVLNNLIKNAIYAIEKKGEGKGEIVISLSVSDTMNHLIVKDSGVGATEEELEKMFDSFYTTKSEGAGIGLSFCRKMVAEMKGTITASSVLGEFMEFTVSLPRIESE